MILSDKEIIGIKDYAELIGKLRLIAKDCNWQLLEDAADTIDELRRDAARYRWLREQHWSDKTLTVTKSKYVEFGRLTYSLEMLDQAIDAAIKESK